MVEGKLAQTAESLFMARRADVELPAKNFIRSGVKREVAVELGRWSMRPTSTLCEGPKPRATEYKNRE